MDAHKITDALLGSQAFIYDCAVAARHNGADTMQAYIIQDKLVLVFHPQQYQVTHDSMLAQPARFKELPESIEANTIETYQYDLVVDRMLMMREIDKLIDELIDDVYELVKAP
ncbi:hypothetical protein [Vibrio jasicida]|uniref:hypothetical protein n=1 Tax=Vibrio jasicida TaxID=766224 RepID=UPI0005ED4B92|nr:hypothetical protein [Vibrio jasicida]